MKYVDDLTLAESIDMATQLDITPVEERPQPDTFRARTGHQFKPQQSMVYDQLKNIQNYAEVNKMKLNVPKTKLILFNPCISKDFMPEFMIEDTRIDLVEQVKLLGVVITSNLSWSANTDSITERCNKKNWILRRLKKLGASQEDLLDVYTKQIRSLAEFAVPVWNSSLTGEDISNLERLQKTALHIILSDQYSSYSSALKKTGLEKLSDRRSKICIKFAKRAQKHSKFSNWFKPNPKRNKRLQQPKFRPVVFKKDRFKKSPLSYLTNLLNNQ